MASTIVGRAGLKAAWLSRVAAASTRRLSSGCGVGGASSFEVRKRGSAPGTRSGARAARGKTGTRLLATSTEDAFALSEDQVASYESEGFLVLPGFASEAEVAEMRARGDALVEGFDPKTISIFSTKKQEKTMNGKSNFDSRQYFLDSASDVSFFFEEGAFDAEGNLSRAKEKSINKIGHALHDLDPAFRAFSRSAKMAGMLHSLGYKKPTPVQSMYIFKQPRIGGEVVPHQDSTFLYTDPPSVIGIWLALEDATVENGCLWGWRKSHRSKEVERRMMLNGESGEIYFDKDPVPHSLDEYEPIEAKAGTLVIFHGQFYHMSYENKSSKSRHAYTFHVVEGSKGYEWAQDNWLRRKDGFPFEPLA